MTPRALDRYAAKRDFRRSPEPKAAAARASETSPIFVVQRHAARRLHYDLRLEHDGALLSWAVPRGLSDDPGVRRLAMRTEDHPLAYADFEGTIPAGEYGAGAMIIWDRGALSWLNHPVEGLANGKLEIMLRGKRLRGAYHLVRIKPNPGEHGEPWLVFRAKANPSDSGAPSPDTSVISGRTLEDVHARAPADPSRLPPFRPPALATLAQAPPSGPDWLHEVKYDGYRLQASCDGGAVRLFTRAGLDWTAKFAALADALASLALDRALLDGEAVVVDARGRTSFGALQNALGGVGGHGVSYFAFDLLTLGGEDQTRLPLRLRKERLRAALAHAAKAGPIYFSDHVVRDGAAMLAKICAAGLEGIVSKRADKAYPAGRSASWIKTKCEARRDFVVGGYTPSTRGRSFASLLVGEWKDGELVYRGRIGAGFDAASLAALADRMAPLARETSAFTQLPVSIAQSARFVTPALIEVTEAGYIRHGVFLGVRDDKPASEARMEAEQPPPSRARLTHPEKLLFPESGLTKAALANYLASAAPHMAPYVLGRPISLVRCPQGRGGSCFFQKHASAGFPDAFGSVEIKEGNGAAKRYLTAPTIDAIVACAQIGALEIHIWGSRVDALERPDRLVIDLDPDEALPFDHVRRAAIELRELFAHAGIVSFALLTGGKGVHVIAPLARRQPWPVVSAFADGVAHMLERLDSTRFTANMSKARRSGKIFVDHLRNRRGATAIAPYSPRARVGAPAAAPVTWDELSELASAHVFDLARLSARATRGPDPWRDYASVRQSLTRAAFKAFGLAGPPRD